MQKQQEKQQEIELLVKAYEETAPEARRVALQYVLAMSERFPARRMPVLTLIAGRNGAK